MKNEPARGDGELATHRPHHPQAQDTQPNDRQDLTEPNSQQLTQAPKLSKGIKIATFNVQGINSITKRQEIYKWANEAGIDIIALQETQMKEQSKEESENYITYFASDPKTLTTIRNKGKGKGKGQAASTFTKESAGVGISVKKEWKHKIKSVEQINSRIISLEIDAIPAIKVISAYAPQADWDEETKQKLRGLRKRIRKTFQI